MDGHPKTLEQARKLFLIDRRDLEEEEEEYEDEDTRASEADILPELVVVLEASDEFLKERIMNLPEKEIQNTHYTEEHMLRRLREYRYPSLKKEKGIVSLEYDRRAVCIYRNSFDKRIVCGLLV